MVEVAGKIVEQYVYVMIDPRSTHSYITPRIAKIFSFKKLKHRKSWLVQLATGTERKVKEMSISHGWVIHLYKLECSITWFL